MRAFIMAVLAALIVTGCGVEANKTTTTVTNSNNTTDNSVTTTGSAVQEQNSTDTADNDWLNVPDIANYSTGKVVLDCNDEDNIRGLSCYKCLELATETYAETTAGDITEVDRYKVDDTFVLEFQIDGVNRGDTVEVSGLVATDGNRSAAVIFGTARCVAGE